MNNDELLFLIYNDVRSMKLDIQDMKCDIRELKAEMKEVKEDIRVLKADVATLKTEMKEVKERQTGIEYKLENETDKNIRIIAECQLDMRQRFCDMFNMLREEREKDQLPLRVRILETDMAVLKEKIA